ncbi:ABC transporter permease [Vibrio rumoiensis]|uniref:ABC transporter permease n=1 Tax=Vibrio rumoiensis 1S-45 TaxID=1188252 RepID=A0A1E5E722_9VIBR|nr:ABC transporter permease [Vibrio rumoiensis]OEF30150.1 ABC transporter permease [Vibrio rumoiensis 1S-45]
MIQVLPSTRMKRSLLQMVITFAVILSIWQLCVVLFNLPKYIVPSPLNVWVSLHDQASLLLRHSIVTLQEIGLGLLLGVVLGLSSALILLLNSTINRWLLPVLIISQAIPVFALAPVLMLWFGYGIASKVVMSAIIIFFPITVCCYDGLKNTPKGYLELAKTFGLTPWQTLWRVKLPSALPALGSGLCVAVVIAPIGAVIGEWVGASAGLGYYMLQSNARMQTADMFAALFILSCLSIFLYFLTDFLLNRFIVWTASE